MHGEHDLGNAAARDSGRNETAGVPLEIESFTEWSCWRTIKCFMVFSVAFGGVMFCR